MIRALQIEKSKALLERESLTVSLAQANAMIRIERAKQEQFRRQFEKVDDAHSRIYKTRPS